MTNKSEFTAEDSVNYDQRSALRWIVSHIWRYPVFLLGCVLFYIISASLFALAPGLVGQAAALVEQPGSPALQSQLLWLGLGVLACLVVDGIANMLASFAATNISNRFAADARGELYASLLGKSQTVFDRLRVGDLMA